MNLSIKQINYFVYIAELENISLAALKLGITQPALSSAVKKIEQELDIQLFDRTGGHVFLNTAGKMLLPRLKQLLASYNRVESSAQRINSECDETVCIPIPSCPWTHDLRAELSKDPRIRIHTPQHVVTGAGVPLVECDISMLCQYDPRPASIGYKYTDIMEIRGLCSISSAPLTKEDFTFKNIVIPSDSMIYGIENILLSRQATETGMTSQTIQKLNCFDQIAASCIDSNNIGIFPGSASVWKPIYGERLNIEDIEPFKDYVLTVSLVSSTCLDPILVEEIVALTRDKMTRLEA